MEKWRNGEIEKGRYGGTRRGKRGKELDKDKIDFQGFMAGK